MGYHHLALAARDMAAIHHFYEEVMGFELVKVEIAPVPDGGWAKHFFYRMDGDDSRFIAFWKYESCCFNGLHPDEHVAGGSCQCCNDEWCLRDGIGK